MHELVANSGLQVFIPYREGLLKNLPTTLARVLRDAKVIALINGPHPAPSFHAGNRGEAVVSTIDDYKEVYRLVAEPLAYGLEVQRDQSVVSRNLTAG